MQSKANTVEQYIDELPEERKKAIIQLRKAIKTNLPKGFAETMSYGMIGYCVPLSIFPAGYHCNPKLPLPFINVGSQKNFIVMHHMGIYGSKKLLDWFIAEHEKENIGKLNMGKGCIRFTNVEKIPYKLIGQLCSKITVEEWIAWAQQFNKKTKSSKT